MTAHPPFDALQSFMEGELPPAKRAEVQRHLPNCPQCRSRVAELSRLVADLHSIPEIGLPRSFARDIVETATTAQSHSTGRTTVVALVEALACALALAALSLLIVYWERPAPAASGDLLGAVSVLLGSPFEVDGRVLGILSALCIAGMLLIGRLLSIGGSAHSVRRPPAVRVRA